MSANDADTAVVGVAQPEVGAGCIQESLSDNKENAVNGSGDLHTSEPHPKEELLDLIPPKKEDILVDTTNSDGAPEVPSLEKEDTGVIPEASGAVEAPLVNTETAIPESSDSAPIIQTKEEESDHTKEIAIQDVKEATQTLSVPAPTDASNAAEEAAVVEKKDDAATLGAHDDAVSEKAEADLQTKDKDNAPTTQIEAPSDTTESVTEVPSLPEQSSDLQGPVTETVLDTHPASTSEPTKIEPETLISESQPSVTADDKLTVAEPEPAVQPDLAPLAATEAKNEEHDLVEVITPSAATDEVASIAATPQQVEEIQVAPVPDPDVPETVPTVKAVEPAVLDTIPSTTTSDQDAVAPEPAAETALLTEVVPEAEPHKGEVTPEQVKELTKEEVSVDSASVPGEETPASVSVIQEPVEEVAHHDDAIQPAAAAAPSVEDRILADSDKDAEVGHTITDEDVAIQQVEEIDAVKEPAAEISATPAAPVEATPIQESEVAPAAEPVAETPVDNTSVVHIPVEHEQPVVPVVEAHVNATESGPIVEDDVKDAEVGHAVTDDMVTFAPQAEATAEVPLQSEDHQVAEAVDASSAVAVEPPVPATEVAEPIAEKSEPEVKAEHVEHDTPASQAVPEPNLPEEKVADVPNVAAVEPEANVESSAVVVEVAESTPEPVPAVTESAEPEPISVAVVAPEATSSEVKETREAEVEAAAKEEPKVEVEEAVKEESKDEKPIVIEDKPVTLVEPTPASVESVPAVVEEDVPEPAPAPAEHTKEATPAEAQAPADIIVASVESKEVEEPAQPAETKETSEEAAAPAESKEIAEEAAQPTQPEPVLDEVADPANTKEVDEVAAEPAVPKESEETTLSREEPKVVAEAVIEPEQSKEVISEVVESEEPEVVESKEPEVVQPKVPEVVLAEVPEVVESKEVADKVVEPITMNTTSEEEIVPAEETQKSQEDPEPAATVEDHEAPPAQSIVAEPVEIVKLEDTELIPEPEVKSVEPEQPTQPIDDAPKADSNWVPSFHVTTQGSSEALLVHDEPEPVDESVPAAPTVVVAEDGEAPAKAESESSQLDSPQLTVDDASNEASSEPARPWTPSYSVHSQGSPRPSFSVPAEEAAEKKPTWTRSYSVHSQGSSPLLSPTALSSEPIQLDLQGSAVETDKPEDKNTLGPARSYSVHSQGNSPLLAPADQFNEPEPTPLVLQEPVPQVIEPVVAEELIKVEAEPVATAVESTQQETVPEPSSVVTDTKEIRVSTPKLIINDGQDEEIQEAEQPKELEVKAASPQIERTVSPSWVPSYSVEQQGSPIKESVPEPTAETQKVVEEPSQAEAAVVNVKEAVEEDQVRQPSPVPSIQVQDEQSAPKEVEAPEPAKEQERQGSPSTWTPSYSVTTVGSPPQSSDKFEPLNAHSFESSTATTDTAASNNAHQEPVPEVEHKEPELSKERSAPTESKVPFVAITDSLVETFPEHADSQAQKPTKLTVSTEPPSSPDTLTSGTSRTRHESIASSRFFPGGWFSPRSEGRASVEHAHGEFSAAKSRVSSDDVPDSPSEMEDNHSAQTAATVQPVKEEKGRWCVVM